MSQEISRKPSGSRKALGKCPKPKIRGHFFRLFQDMTDQLNAAVELRTAGGHSQADIADRVDMDPAFLSRVLAGQAGTNLRSIAAVLCATDHVMRVIAIPMEESMAQRAIAAPADLGALRFTKTAPGFWEFLEENETEHPLSFGNAKVIFTSVPSQGTPVNG